MLDEAVRLGCEQLGIRTRLALCAEWEAYAAACLRSRMEDESMEPAPIWCGDLGGLDCKPFRGLVGILCAGLPCQPYSVAGRQEGKEDARSWGDGDGPIPHFLRIVAECRPAVVFIENVPPFVTGIRDQRTGRINYPFRDIGSVLSGMGYQIEDPLFITAEAVGASHRRERVFILAHCDRGRIKSNIEAGRSGGTGSQRDELADSLRSDGEPRTRRERVFDDGAELGNAGSAFSAGRQPEQLTGERHSGANQDLEITDGQSSDLHSRERAWISDVSGGSPELAQPESGGQRELREPSGRDGLVDGDCRPVGSPTGRQRGKRQSGRGSDRRAAVGGTGGPMDADGLGLAEPIGERLQGRERRTADPQREALERSGESLGDTSGTRSSADAARRGSRDSISQSSCGIFAPGPSANWRSIPEHCWPAIEPGFRLLVDGLALVVDQSRADSLRCGGNGVVAIQGAVAFIELMRRVKGR